MIEGVVLTVIVNALLIAVEVDKQLAFDVNNTLIVSLLTRDVVEYFAKFVPTAAPFLYH